MKERKKTSLFQDGAERSCLNMRAEVTSLRFAVKAAFTEFICELDDNTAPCTHHPLKHFKSIFLLNF